MNLSDLEISKRLALAIGWQPKRLMTDGGRLFCFVTERDSFGSLVWLNKPFDYQDWAVVGPIAATYNCFPYRVTRPIEGGYTGEWNAIWQGGDNIADTPQKSIAMAVIRGAKT